MRGAQFLLEIRARRSRRAFSISFRYSASTLGFAIAQVNYKLQVQRALCFVGEEGAGVERLLRLKGFYM